MSTEPQEQYKRVTDTHKWFITQQTKLSRNTTITVGLAISVISAAIWLTWSARGIVEQLAVISSNVEAIKVETQATAETQHSLLTKIDSMSQDVEDLQEQMTGNWSRQDEQVAWVLWQSWISSAMNALETQKPLPPYPCIKDVKQK